MYTNSTNTSSGPLTYAEHPESIWYWSLRGVIAFIAIIGNGMVIYLIATRRRLWTQPNCFVLSLSLADFGTGIINTPLEFACTMLGSCDWWLVQTIKDIFLLGSVLNLCAITLDRYIAVRYSFRYILILTNSKCACILFFTWILSVTTPFVFFTVIKYNKLATYRVISFFRLFLCQVLPIVGLLAAFLAMLRISKAQRKKVIEQKQQIDYNYSSNPGSSTTRIRTRSSRNSSSVHFIGIMVLFFVFCYSLTLYRAFSNYVLFTSVPSIIVPLSRLLYYLNSALDFVVYALFKHDIKRELRSFFRRNE